MYIIHTKNNSGDLGPVIMCEDKEIFSVLGLLEQADTIDCYKLISSGGGAFTQADINFSFCGYAKPAGKLVVRLYDEQ